MCPDIYSLFDGISVSFEADDGVMNVTISGSSLFSSASSSFDYDKRSVLKLEIIKEKNFLRVVLSDKKREVVKSNIGDKYDFGYISLFGESKRACTDNCKVDMMKFNFTPLSKDVNKKDYKNAENNKKFIEKEMRSKRDEQKMTRRGKMLKVSDYIDEILNFKYKLNEKETDINLSDAFVEAKELIIRAKDCITAEFLNKYLEEKIIPVLNNASAKFSRISDALFQLKLETIDLWDETKKHLKEINNDVNKSFEMLREVVMEEASKISHENNLNRNLRIPKQNQEKFTSFLLLIFLLELILYLLFFIRYHIKITKKRL